MAQYKIRFKDSVRKDLHKIPKKDIKRIFARIDSLADNPTPTQAQMLSGDNKYRIRQGLYRILYQIQDEILTVCIVKIGHRKHAYQT